MEVGHRIFQEEYQKAGHRAVPEQHILRAALQSIIFRLTDAAEADNIEWNILFAEEPEADYIGMLIRARAGYDLQVVTPVLNKLKTSTVSGTIASEQISQRIQLTSQWRTEIPQILGLAEMPWNASDEDRKALME
ncbi:MAG: hypothetical protein Q9209_004698 [Squamulea sp. 1 TL-2023]